MIDFSLILNSRGRPKLLKNLLESIERNTVLQNQIEVLIRADEGNYDTEFLDELCNKYEWLRFFYGERVKNLHVSLNELANKAIGSWIWTLNDDCELQTLGWDDIVLSKIYQYKLENQIKDEILYIKTECDSIDRDKNAGYASFPIVSKKSVETVGYKMHNSLVGLGGDRFLFRCYQELNRVIHCPELMVKHLGHNELYKIRNPDEVGAFMRINTYNHPVDVDKMDISSEVNKLKEYIEKVNSK